MSSEFDKVKYTPASLTHIQHADDVIRTATGKRATIRTECYAKDITRMPCEGADMCATVCVPHTKSFIVTTTCECATIGTERYAKDITRMP